MTNTFEAVVLIADGVPDSQNECFHIDGLILPSTVHVTENFDPLKALGTAKLRRDGNKVVATFEIEEEDFNPSGFYPAIGGTVKELTTAGKSVVLSGVSITDIGLSKERNADTRIEPIP